MVASIKVGEEWGMVSKWIRENYDCACKFAGIHLKFLPRC